MKAKAPNFGTLLLYGAAAYQATQYARAFHQIDSSSIWAEVGGILAGAVVNFGLAYAAGRLPRIRAKRQQQFASIAFWALVIVTPVFLAPINYKTMGDLWLEAPLLRWVLAALSASVVDIAIALVAFASGSLLSLEATPGDGPTTGNDAGSEPKRRSGRSAGKAATLKLYQCECGQTFTDRFKYSGHTRTCATRKAIRTGQGLIPVDRAALTPRKAGEE